MKSHLWKLLCAVVILTMFVPALAGCATPAPPPAATEPPPTEAPPAPTATPVPPEPTPTTGPTVGGTMLRAFTSEPATLDYHKIAQNEASWIQLYLNATLVALSPDGEFVPWLADSWEIADDGMSVDFKLREDVTFHDGTPLTADDYAWTLQRAIDPETASPGAGTMLGDVESAEAVDEHTLRLNLKGPSGVLFFNLAVAHCWTGPIPKAAFEEMGEGEFGRHPIGTGPFMFKEWVAGEKVVLERNPDYNWGPSFVQGGPPYIEQLEFRFLPEYSTIVAALEAGEIDVAEIEAKDVQRILDTGIFGLWETQFQGAGVFVAMNTSISPFDDINARKAFNMAVDKDVLVEAAMGGAAVALDGPITPGTGGYWAGVEEIGYEYDLDAAKDLMEQAGWVDTDGDGIREKDGESLSLTMNLSSNFEDRVRTAQILQEQYRDLGVDIELEPLENTLNLQKVWPGDYEIAVMQMAYPEFDLMRFIFSSAMIGMLNMSIWSDPELDELLTLTKTTMDPEERQEYANQVQGYLVENAVIVPLYGRKILNAWNNRFTMPLTHPIMQEYFNVDDSYLVE